MFFIDPLAKENTAENVFVVKTPRDLTDMFIVISELMGDRDVEFLILDTVEDLVFYNGFDRARMFLNALIRYIKRKGKILILLTREREDEQEEKMHHLAKTLADANINIEYVYAFTFGRDKALIILRVDDINRAIEVLERENVLFKGKVE